MYNPERAAFGAPTPEKRGGTPNVDERLATLEARTDSISELRHYIDGRFADLNARITELRGDVNLRFAQVNGRFTELRDDMNARYGDVGGRFADTTGRFDQIDRRVEQVDRRLEDINGRFDELTAKLDRQLTWMMATALATLMAVAGTLLGILYR